MIKIQIYECVSSIFTKINKSKTLNSGEAEFLKHAIVNICERGSVKYDDIIQIIEFMPSIASVSVSLVGYHPIKVMHKRDISLYEMLFFLDYDGAII